ncbi:MAG: Os1348 family NHLP clan protein [Chloroflexota bacterium]|nr:Os1348 family NHLP clan protein [Chloroflexota bacterium]
MSVPELQACLARLYVDGSFRKLFYIDPDDTLRGYELNAAEALAIKSIDRDRLEFFAESLVNKRKHEFERAYPLLFRLHSVVAERLYRRYYDLRVASPYQPGIQDITEFGLFLEESLASAADAPPYAVDLARYERLSYAALVGTGPEAMPTVEPPEPAEPATIEASDRLRSSGGIQLAAFMYDVAALEDKLESSSDRQNSIEPDRGEYWILFTPRVGSSPARTLRVNSPTRTLLQLCDGRATMADIVAAVEQTFGATQMGEVVRTALERLLAVGAIEIVRRHE